jgi:hypothetical protein
MEVIENFGYCYPAMTIMQVAQCMIMDSWFLSTGLACSWFGLVRGSNAISEHYRVLQ